MQGDGFGVLLTSCKHYCWVNRGGSARAPMQVAVQPWAVAHGIATLKVNQMLDVFGTHISARDILGQGTIVLLDGLHKDHLKWHNRPAPLVAQLDSARTF